MSLTLATGPLARAAAGVFNVDLTAFLLATLRGHLASVPAQLRDGYGASAARLPDPHR